MMTFLSFAEWLYFSKLTTYSMRKNIRKYFKQVLVCRMVTDFCIAANTIC